MAYDLIDGGIPATFIDGPKKGHVGVVDMDRGGAPVETLTFLTDLVYVRVRKCRVAAIDAQGARQSYKGIAYRVDPQCGFMARMKREVDAAVQAARAGMVDTQ